MNDPEHFLSRWSRRKRAAEEDDQPLGSPAPIAPTAPATAAASDDRGCGEAQAASGSVAAEPPFDITRLPPLDSITATTDIRAFLAPGVPPELSRAALRRAWSADPNIRNFVGLADYDWDYHAAGSMGGFGPLEMTEELRQFMARIVGGEPSVSERPPPGASQAGSPAAESLIESGDHSGDAGHGASVADACTSHEGPVTSALPPETGPQVTAAAPAAQDAAPQYSVQSTGETWTQSPRPRGRALPR